MGKVDPSGLEYIAVRGNTVYWVVEENGYLYNPDIEWVRVGRLKGKTVYFDKKMGGGRASLAALKRQASRFWNEYGDISKLAKGARRHPIRGAIDRVRSGRLIKTGSAAAQITTAAGKGLKTGSKAVVNATASTVVSTVTFGGVDNVQAWKVTDEDIRNGYNTSYAFARGGTEILVGVATGAGATKLAQVGTKAAKYGSYAIRVGEAAQNVVQGGRGMADMVENGVTLENSVQVLGAGFATVGDFTGTLRKVPKATSAVDEAAEAASDATAAARKADAAVDSAAAAGRVDVPGGGASHTVAMRQVSSGGVRGEMPLTAMQKAEVKAYLQNFDLDEVNIRWVDHTNLNTAYGHDFRVLIYRK